MRQIAREKALKMVFMQFLAVIVLSVVALWFGKIYCISVVLGGIAAVIPNLLFAVGLFNKLHQRRPEQILMRFYMGGLIKVMLSVAIMVLVIMTMQVSMLAVLLSFLVAMLTFSVVGARQ
ncbi:MAG: ATP synthase subunit I [Gammaproteobacteria bacterium]|nr:ATP synthase subunit I [Gammaproteobacteria bacterium]MCH9745018.1 ATP synthase subunit I [Gammaproteobacteria bacterium]